MKHLVTLFGLYFFFLCLSWANAHADFYRYTDKAGTVVITDKYASIPAEYRSKVKTIKDQKYAPERSTPALSDNGVQAEPEVQKSVDPREGGGWLKQYLPLAVVAGILVGSFFLVRAVASSLGVARLGTLIYLAICACGAVYLYRIYSDQMVMTFQSLRENAQNVKKNVETRGEKTNNSLGDLREPASAPTTASPDK